MNKRQKAIELGKQHGHSSGTWAIDGNTSTQTCEEFLRKIEDCDFDGPAPSAEALAELAEDGLADFEVEYTDAFFEAQEAEVVRAARAQLGPDCDPYYKHPED